MTKRIFYDRREWSIFIIAFAFCVWPFFGSLTYPKIRPNYRNFYYVVCFIAGPLLTLADQGSLRITLTKSELKLHRGFFFCRRKIPYAGIVKVTFEKEPKASYGKSKGFFALRCFTAGSKYSGFKIDLSDGDYCVVQSRYTHEILTAMKLAAPFLNVNWTISPVFNQ